MSDPKTPAEGVIDSVTSAIEVIWSWLSAEKPQSALALLDGRTDDARASEPAVIETEGEAVGETHDVR